MKTRMPTFTEAGTLKTDLILLLLLGVLGSAAAFFSINIPHTEVYIEVRWIFGYLGFVMIRRLPLAVVLAMILSAAGFHIVPLYVAFLGNLFYSLPFGLCLRLFARKIMGRMKRVIPFGLAWFAAVLLGYQLFANPLVWIVLGLIRDTLSLSFVLEVYTIQPYWEESIAVALISALTLSSYKQYLDLRVREHHLSTILHSIGDAVIVTDAQGMIEMMNPVAEDLTGWTMEEAKGKRVKEVFHIVDARTMAEAENPVNRVLEEGIVVGLANHTMLISRKGERYQIADSGAPVSDAHGGVRGVVLVFRDVTEDYRMRNRIDRELREKEILLQEVHHRVKNNLQVISSLLNLQSGDLEDPRIQDVFEDSRRRIFSMALVHNQLYQTGDFDRIDFNDYVRDLFNELLMGSGRSDTIKISTDIDRVVLDLKVAIPCGLILNELISNSLKHAFGESSEGRIEVSLHSDDEERYVLTYRDDGVGIPAEVEPTHPSTLGMSLVQNLSDQIGGTLETVPAEKGHCIRISFRV